MVFSLTPGGRIERREDRLGVEAHGRLVQEPIDLCLPRPRRRIAGAVGQDQRDTPLDAVQDQLPAGCHVELGRIPLADFRDQQVLPAGLPRVRLVAGIQHPVWKLVKKDARLNVAFDLLGDDLEGDLPEFLVRVRNGDDHHPHRDRRRRECQRHDRPEQPIRAHAAREECHRFAVGGHPSEADEDTYEQPHGDGQPEGLGHQQEQNPSGGLPWNALGDQPLEVLHDRRQLENEGENQDREDERRQDFADDVAIEGLEHSRERPCRGS